MRALLVFLIGFSLALGHGVTIQLESKDGVVLHINAKENDGASLKGAKLLLRSLATQKTLYETRIKTDGVLEVKIPSEPYEVLIDEGDGELNIKKGLAPKNGFGKNASFLKHHNIAFLSTFVASIVLVFLCLYYLRRGRRFRLI